MLMDPCNATLVPGMYGSSYGLLARFRNVNNFDSYFSGSKCGFVIWFPSYHGTTPAISGNASFFQFGAATSSGAPTLNNYGLSGGNSASYAKSFLDPAHVFVESATCQDARTLSACLRVTYTGTTSNAQGIIVPLTNIPLTTLLYGGVGSAPPTIGELMQYGTNEKRAIGTYEVKYRPQPTGVGFIDTASPCVDVNSGSPSTIPSSTANVPPTGIGFVFLNVDKLSDFSISAYKNVEWRPEPTSGLVSSAPRGVENPSILSKSLNYLDSRFPGWQSQMADRAFDIVSDGLSSMVLGGAGRAVSAATNYLQLVN